MPGPVIVLDFQSGLQNDTTPAFETARRQTSNSPFYTQSGLTGDQRISLTF